MSTDAHRYQAPRNCPVCSERLALTRLSCDSCGTELAGHFPTCEFCSLGAEDRQTLQVFLGSRGNMREVERHLAVSYPTARARFDTILEKLGLPPSNGPEPADEGKVPTGAHASSSSTEVLSALADGKIDVDEALKRLS